jgi:Flp pilus assembly secretin CpaC
MQGKLLFSLLDSFRWLQVRWVVILILFSVAIILFDHGAVAQNGKDALKLNSIEPPVGEQGNFSLQEYKVSLVIDLGVLQARLFKIKNRIIRTSISDPRIAEPVVISANEILLLGKAPGAVKLTMWDDAGNFESIILRVSKDYSPGATAMGVGNAVPDNFPSDESVASFIPPARSGVVLLEKGKTVSIADSAMPDRGNKTPDRNFAEEVPGTQQYVYDILPPLSKPALVMRCRFVKDGVARRHCIGDLVVDVKQFQSRTFRLDRRLARFSTTDPGIAEPMVLSDTEFLVLGKAPGLATIGLWDYAGNIMGIEARVGAPSEYSQKALGQTSQGANKALEGGANSAIQNNFKAAIPEMMPSSMALLEVRPSMDLGLEKSEVIEFKMKKRLVRTALSDSGVAALLPTEDGLYLWGKEAGRVTAFVWDDSGNVTGISLRVNGASHQNATAPSSFAYGRKLNEAALLDKQHQLSVDSERTLLPPFGRPCRAIEVWTGSRKDLWELPPAQSVDIANDRVPLNPRQVHNLGVSAAGSEWHRAITNSQTLERSKNLTNEAAEAIADRKYQEAIDKLVTALYIDFSYQPASVNLTAAYNGYGEALRNEPRKAIEQFHKALYVSPNNATVLKNLEGIIRFMGKDPHNFQDRVALGDAARLSGDLTGAVIEYEAALQINEDIRQRAKLFEAFSILGDAQDKQCLLAVPNG